MSSPRSLPIALLQQGQWMASVCNACRYCEGYCATFPALERRIAFGEADLTYLANLCHNCGACYHACQYAPPHEFQINFPRMMAQIRSASYRKFAWPGRFAALYERNGAAVLVVTLLSLLAFIIGMTALAAPGAFWAPHPDATGAFYAVMPHEVMAGLFGAVALYVMLALAIGLIRFWNETGERVTDLFNPRPTAVHSATHCGCVISAAATRTRAALPRASSLRSRAGGSITSRSTGSCFASHRPRWPRSFTTFWGGAPRTPFSAFPLFWAWPAEPA